MEPSGLLAAAMVATGGAAGALARYGLSIWLARPDVRFPYAILLCNVGGCLLMGALMWFVMHKPTLAPTLRLLLVVGLLGSLTTFSTFGYDTIELARQGHVAQAIWNVVANVVLGLGAVALGAWAAWMLVRPR
ncbi:MAG: fluoride efflux transporter CrcB [Phycisphaerales bacterium JB039]